MSGNRYGRDFGFRPFWRRGNGEDSCNEGGEYDTQSRDENREYDDRYRGRSTGRRDPDFPNDTDRFESDPYDRYGERTHGPDDERFYNENPDRRRRSRSIWDDARDSFREAVGERPRFRGASRSHVRCRDIMTRDVTCAAPDSTLREVAAMMRDEDTGVIPVVEQLEAQDDPVDASRRVQNRVRSNGKLVGLITDRDIVVRAIADGRDIDTRADEVMTTDIHTARPNDRVIEVIRKLGDKQVRRIPVTDGQSNLVGIISMADVALETENDRELADALEEISSGSSFWSKMFG